MKPIEYVEVLKEVKSLLKDFGFGKNEIKAYTVTILKEIGKDRRAESFRQELATEKQRKFMEDLGIEFPGGVTKEEASRLIWEKLKE
ncbi:hypothetical protein AKJ43_01885 [candidate division MSBL1 archaeon SCGC-AAA261D19]|uniref:Uncharacterized protein n=1 Tax=candidate division MSBL1 archaeon SCGC-AAA261D19 TaxID=1698273 RepID=A0A133V7H7_9EURY|nr:hypothetical protein AKJ43_01885 [candidate division MSBL1 archaeon SCGC-AAA261D19]